MLPVAEMVCVVSIMYFIEAGCILVYRSRMLYFLADFLPDLKTSLSLTWL